MFISGSGPATLTLKSIPSFMVHHIQSILPRPRWTASDWTHVSRAPSLPFFPLLAAFCVTVTVHWEATGHSNPRLAASSISWLFAPMPCFPSILPIFNQFSAPCSACNWQLGDSVFWQKCKVCSQWQSESDKCACMEFKQPLALSRASFLSMLRTASFHVCFAYWW